MFGHRGWNRFFLRFFHCSYRKNLVRAAEKLVLVSIAKNSNKWCVIKASFGLIFDLYDKFVLYGDWEPIQNFEKQWHIQKSMFLFDNSQSVFSFDISRTFQSIWKYTKRKHKQYYHQRMRLAGKIHINTKMKRTSFISTVCVCFGDTMLISVFLESQKICCQSHALVCHSLIHDSRSTSLWLQRNTHFRSTPLQIVHFI